MSSSSRKNPIVIEKRPITNQRQEIIVHFEQEVNCLDFFQYCYLLQEICDSGKYEGHDINRIIFDLKITDWFDTLALCYLVLFAWNVKQHGVEIDFIDPIDIYFASFLKDNGFRKLFYMLSQKRDTNDSMIEYVEYSHIHKRFLPVHILTSYEEVPEMVDTVKRMMKTAFGDIVKPKDLEYSISKIVYFLQETLDNVFCHAYSDNDSKPCTILIRQVDSNGMDDIEQYSIQHIENCPYIDRTLFENMDKYLEIYIADTGMGLRRSFLQAQDMENAEITDTNIYEYIFTEGRRSHKRVNRQMATAFGGLYDISQQFRKDHDYLGAKTDQSWFFGSEAKSRVNLESIYGTYDGIMHGFALVAAIQIKKSMIDEYPLNDERKSMVESYKQVLFSDNRFPILDESLKTVTINDYRTNLERVIPTREPNANISIALRYPDLYFVKKTITNKILDCNSNTLIIAGVQESEIKKYQSLIESYIIKEKYASNVILISDTLYAFVYVVKSQKYTFSKENTRSYITNKDQEDYSKSFFAFLRLDRAYNSLCIWWLAKEKDDHVFLNHEIQWDNQKTIQGYLDFSQLCRIPACRHFCISRLKVLYLDNIDIYFRCVDRLTEEICEQANYLMDNSITGKCIYIGSIYVSGSSAKLKSPEEKYIYFFKHNNANDDSNVFSIFGWVSKIDWLNKAFDYYKENSRYERIGFLPYVADHGADYWAQRHYINHSSEYVLSQSETYTLLQRKVGIHPATLRIGHIDCCDRHDMFGLGTASFYASDLSLNEISNTYDKSSPSVFYISKVITALLGTKCRKKAIQSVLSSDLFASRKERIANKVVNFISEEKKSGLNTAGIYEGIVLYHYDFQTSEIMEGLVSLFSEEYQKRIIPIVSVNRNYSEAPMLIPPLVLDRIEETIKAIKTKKTDGIVNATVFIATSFTMRIKEELMHILRSVGADNVFFVALIDRQRILLKSDRDSSLTSFCRVDLPALGSSTSCPICKSFQVLHEFANELINSELSQRIDDVLSIWDLTKESDSTYNKGIEQAIIILSDETKELIQKESELYNQGTFNIYTNIALAMFVVENAIITSSSQLLSNLLSNKRLIVDINGDTDETTSSNMKILLICSYLLSAGTDRTSERQIMSYITKLCILVDGIKETNKYTELALITICAMPDIFQKHIHDSFVEKKWDDLNSQKSIDSLLIHLVLYYIRVHKSGEKCNEDYAALLECFFRSRTSKLELIYEMLLYSEQDYHQSHVQALSKIASSQNLPLPRYKKGLDYIQKIEHYLNSKEIHALFHDPKHYSDNENVMKNAIIAAKNELLKIVENYSEGNHPEAKEKVSRMLQVLHNINTQWLYLRVPSQQNETDDIQEWLSYCQSKAFERIPAEYQYDKEELLININRCENIARSWFYSFNDITEETINLYVDMLTKSSGLLSAKYLLDEKIEDKKYKGIINVVFTDEYAQIEFYNASDEERSETEIRKIKDSKMRRPSMLPFLEFKKKRGECFKWEYVEQLFNQCQHEGAHIFRATMIIPYIDMGSSFSTN